MTYKDSEDKMSIEKEQELLHEAKKRFKAEVELDNHNRTAASDDLEFEIGLNQWDAEAEELRRQDGQVSLQMNLLPKYVNQIVGEMRQNDIQIKVNPDDSEADVEIAHIREGKISDIEYECNAETIRDIAARSQVSCGYGAWRVLTRYSDESVEDAFRQEVYIQSIENPFTVYMDSSATDRNYRDAEYGFVVDTISLGKFKETYPGIETSGFSGNSVFNAVGIEQSSKSEVVIVEYFYKDCTTEKVALLSDGRSMPYDQAVEEVKNSQAVYAAAKAKNPTETDDSYALEIKDTREIKKKKIKWCKMTDDHILEQGDWPGKYIPIILVYGYVVNVNGKRYIFGMVRNAKDAQRSYNYWHTAATETIALSPKAPWMASAKMIEGYEVDYMSSNTRNLPMLKYNHDNNFPGIRPERTPPIAPPMAIFAELNRAEQNIRGTIGMHEVDVGGQGREISGTAIQARQAPGDIASYVFIDNWVKAIEYEGVVINDLLDKIYVEDRDAKVRNIDGSETFTPINTTLGNAWQRIQNNPERYEGMDKQKIQNQIAKRGQEAKFNNIGEGKYRVKISTGPAYQTQRKETADATAKIAMASGQMAPLDKYFLLKTLDNPVALEWSDAVRKTIPPGVLPPKPGEQPPQPPQPSPQEMFAMEMQRLEMQNKQFELQIQMQKLQNEQDKQVTEQSKQLTEQDRRQTEQIQQVKETIKALGELQANDMKGREQLVQVLNEQISQVQ